MADKNPPNNARQIRKSKELTLQKVADRINELFDTDTNHDMIRKLEVGERELTHSWMIKLSEALGCKMEDFIIERSSGVPIKGIIKSGTIVELINTIDKPQAELPVGVEYSVELEAYRFEDDSNAPLAYKDWLLYVGKNIKGGCDDFSNIPYIVKTVEGLIRVRKLRKGYAPGYYNLLNPVSNAIEEDMQIEWCAKMVAITPPKK